MKRSLLLLLMVLITNLLFSQVNEILNVSLMQDTRLVGRGNDNEVILKVTVVGVGQNAFYDLSTLRLNLESCTDLNDIDLLRIYSTGDVDAFDGRTLQGATLIGSCNAATEIECQLSGQIASGNNYLWITANISSDATEGDLVDAALLSISTTGHTYELSNPSPDGHREIVLARTTLYRPGDYNSLKYRIPAVITAKNGDIVAVTDKRKFNDGDLPQDIDIVCNVSSDGGHTWTEPYTIALGTGVNQGFGDCALAHSNDDDGLIAVFVGGPGLWASTPSNPIRSYVCKSYDNGRTWTEPVDITHYIFGVNCVVPEHSTWRASFFGSGNGLRTSTGRIMFVAAIREGNAQSLNNYVVYSDDNGDTWQLSQRASVSGDESKVTELTDGRILMSIRHNGYRWYNISSDGGITWQNTTSTWNDLYAPACNGDIIRYTSEAQGYDKNRLLHSLPYGTQREKVTVYISYDEGETWPTSRCIVPFSSAYSSLCVLDDGTIGLYVEEEYFAGQGYDMVFYNFSLDWLSNGSDTLEPLALSESAGEVSNNIEVYPSPSSSTININTRSLSSLKIHNIKGQIISTYTNINTDTLVVDVNTYSRGVYIINATDKTGKTQKGRFVIE